MWVVVGVDGEHERWLFAGELERFREGVTYVTGFKSPNALSCSAFTPARAKD